MLLSLNFCPTMKIKAGLIIYSVIMILVPPPPNSYTLFITILGTVVACCATLINLLYYRSLPPKRFTFTQPLSMAFMVSINLLSIRDAIFSIIISIFPAYIQEVIEENPLLLCGLMNSRPLKLSIEIFLALYAISKLVLLVDPMKYHALNHEQISVRCFIGVAAYLTLDVALYLVLGNVHYCHPGILKVYAMVLQIEPRNLLDIGKNVHVSHYHMAVDIILLVCIVILEITIQIYAWLNYRKIVALQHQEPPRALKVQPPVNQLIQPSVHQLLQPSVNQLLQPPANQLLQPPVNQLLQPPAYQLLQPPANQPLQPPVNQLKHPSVNQLKQPPKKFKLLSFKTSLLTLVCVFFTLILSKLQFVFLNDSMDESMQYLTLLIAGFSVRCLCLIMPLLWVYNNKQVRQFAEKKFSYSIKKMSSMSSK